MWRTAQVLTLVEWGDSPLSRWTRLIGYVLVTLLGLSSVIWTGIAVVFIRTLVQLVAGWAVDDVKEPTDVLLEFDFWPLLLSAGAYFWWLRRAIREVNLRYVAEPIRYPRSAILGFTFPAVMDLLSHGVIHDLHARLAERGPGGRSRIVGRSRAAVLISLGLFALSWLALWYADNLGDAQAAVIAGLALAEAAAIAAATALTGLVILAIVRGAAQA